MSWSKAIHRTVLAGSLLILAEALSACSFSLVYSGTLAAHPSLNLAYAKPTNRLEQIIYQELMLRFGHSEAKTAPLVTITASGSGNDMMVTGTTNLAKPVEVTVIATLTITARDGSDAPSRSFTRSASADYTRSGQVLANNVAAEEANERAARSAAESLRLALLAALSR
ncbi:MAG: hypothetical protein MO846_02645 [Candidatus Devosia symbiotica]|nr:hypothetical protein [Candidatus Devosia symbiotica]